MAQSLFVDSSIVSWLSFILLIFILVIWHKWKKGLLWQKKFIIITMVKIAKKGTQSLYECEACQLLYQEKEWAEKCEAWCRETNSCNIDIIKHAVDKEE